MYSNHCSAKLAPFIVPEPIDASYSLRIAARLCVKISYVALYLLLMCLRCRAESL